MSHNLRFLTAVTVFLFCDDFFPRCIPCPGNTLRPAGDDASGPDTECTLCAENHRGSALGDGHMCLACPAHRHVASGSDYSKHDTICACDEGYHCEPSSPNKNEELCEPGMYCPTESLYNVPKPCPRGQYSVHGCTSCMDITAGKQEIVERCQIDEEVDEAIAAAEIAMANATATAAGAAA